MSMTVLSDIELSAHSSNLLTNASVLASFSSLSHFPTPLSVLPGIISQTACTQILSTEAASGGNPV